MFYSLAKVTTAFHLILWVGQASAVDSHHWYRAKVWFSSMLRFTEESNISSEWLECDVSRGADLSAGCQRSAVSGIGLCCVRSEGLRAPEQDPPLQVKSSAAGITHEPDLSPAPVSQTHVILPFSLHVAQSCASARSHSWCVDYFPYLPRNWLAISQNIIETA